MAQDTNSRANMTYEAYKQFTNPIDITPIQQQQQFEEGKRRVGIQQEQAKAKRKDELAQDFTLALKHGLVPAFAKGVNEQFDELRQMYINGDVDIDTARAQLMGIEQQIAEFKPVSEGLREVSKNPNDYLYYNEETDTYETDVDAFTRAVYASNGFGKDTPYEQISEAMEYYNRMTSKPKNINNQLADLGVSFWEAKAKEFYPNVFQEEGEFGDIKTISQIVTRLSDSQIEDFAGRLANTPEFLESAEVEFKLQGNEEERKEYEEEGKTEKDYLEDKIKDYIKKEDITQSASSRAPREGSDRDGEEESGFGLVYNPIDKVTADQMKEGNMINNMPESVKSQIGEVKDWNEFLTSPETQVIQIVNKGTGDELKPVNINGKEYIVDRVISDLNRGFVIARDVVDITKKSGDDVTGRFQQEDEVFLPLTETIQNKIEGVYMVDLTEPFIRDGKVQKPSRIRTRFSEEEDVYAGDIKPSEKAKGL